MDGDLTAQAVTVGDPALDFGACSCGWQNRSPR
jgi:hypothetical protein